MMGHKISFYEEIWLFIPKLSLLLLLIWSTVNGGAHSSPFCCLYPSLIQNGYPFTIWLIVFGSLAGPVWIRT